MYVTRESDYAVRCVLTLARARGRLLTGREVAQASSVAPKFVATILHRLAKAGIVEAVRGARGGYRLSRAAKSIALLDVIEVFQASVASNHCAVDRHKCTLSRHCPVHPIWTAMRDDAERRLGRVNFATLAGSAGKVAFAKPRQGGH